MFDPDSRYHALETAVHVTPDGRRVPYKRRRVLPQGAALPALGELVVRAGDRLDLLAAKALHDPLAYWLLCDANDAMDPNELTATPGATLKVSAPYGAAR